METKVFDKDFKNFVIGLTALCVYLAFNLGIGKILNLMGITVSELTKKQTVIISMSVSILVLAILILLYWKTLKVNLKKYTKDWKTLLKRNAKYWGYSLAIMFICNLSIAIIFNRVTSANDQSIRELFNILPVYIILEAALFAPVTEELVFRQSMRYVFKNKYLFIIISGITFGFMHTLASLDSLSDFLYIIPYSVPGFFFAYMLYKEDNVLVPISFHMIHNCMALVLLIIGKLAGAI